MAGLALLAAPPPAPPVGTIKRGELLVDAQTRALWLGVDATLDPKQALLISGHRLAARSDRAAEH